MSRKQVGWAIITVKNHFKKPKKYFNCIHSKILLESNLSWKYELKANRGQTTKETSDVYELDNLKVK